MFDCDRCDELETDILPILNRLPPASTFSLPWASKLEPLPKTPHLHAPVRKLSRLPTAPLAEENKCELTLAMPFL